MSRRRVAFLVTALVAAAAAACQTSASPEASPLAPSASSPAPSAAGPGSSLGGSLTESTGPSPAAPAAIDPDWVTRPALTCGDNKRLFPPEALDGPGLGELGLDPAAAVLRATIADIPDYYPDSGWHRVFESPDGVTFVARGNAETPWFQVTVGLLDGILQPVIQGQCTLAIAAPTGITFARWWLDPDAPPPTAESTQIDILLREQACASGKPRRAASSSQPSPRPRRPSGSRSGSGNRATPTARAIRHIRSGSSSPSRSVRGDSSMPVNTRPVP